MKIISIIISSIIYSLIIGYFSYYVASMRHDVRKMMKLMQNTQAILLGMKIRDDLKLIEEMKRDLRICVENEEFEDAEKLKSLIRTHADNLTEQIELYNKTFGDIANINIEIIKKNGNTEKN